MNALSPFYHGRLALIDLDAGRACAQPMPRKALEQGLGGPALAEALAEDYPGALICAAGPLTGGFAPASGLLTAMLPQEDGDAAHTVLPLGHGAWLRQSGFDALLIAGAAAAPCLIRCADGDCVLEKAGSDLTLAFNRAALRGALLRRTADGRAGLILADSHRAETGSPLDPPPAAGGEYGPLPNGAPIAAAMRRKNILALSLEGGGPLPPMPLPLDNFLRQSLKASKYSGKDALLRELAAGTGGQAVLPSGLSYKIAACHHCPSPCLAWVEAGKDRHLLAADHAGLAAALAACGAQTAACLGIADERGLDLAGLAPLYAGRNEIGAQNDATRAVPAELPEAARIGLLLGLCPRLILREAALSPEALAAALGKDMLPRLSEAASSVTRRVLI